MSFDISQLRGLILDMDGVIWKKYQPLGNLKAIFEGIAARGLHVVLATNNSTKTPAHYLELLAEFGVVLAPGQVINSSLATAQYLSEIHPQGGVVYIMGEKGLHQTLNGAGFHHDESAKNASAVVVGMDRAISYEKIKKAAWLIRAGAPFLATNPDKTFPTPQGLSPGAGTMIAAVEAASGVKATVIGKPQSAMYHTALQQLATSPKETLVVGDRLETDIAGAQNIGCHAALVLSGVSSLAEAQSWHSAPDIIAQDLSEVLDIIS